MSESTKVQFDAQSKTGYLPAARSIVTVVEGPHAGSGGSGSKPTSEDGGAAVKDKPKDTFTAKNWVPWGQNDNFPNEVIEKVGMVGVASGALQYNIQAAHGDDLEAGIFVYENGQKRWEPIDITLPKYSEIYDFFLESDIKDDFIFEAFSDLFWFSNFFPYFILNKGRTRINKLYCAEATYTRIGKKNEQGISDKLYFSAQFPNPTDEPEEIPLLSDYDAYADLISRKSGYRFAVHGYLSSPGKSYYQKSYWDAVRANGWLDVAASIPKYMNAIFKNAMHLKYHIKIPLLHFKSKYKDWDSKDEKVQNQLIEDELNAMDQFLSGADNARKAFFSFVDHDDSGKQNEGWDIEPIADYDKEGKYLPESSAANSEILFAFQTHPDLIGAGTPGGYNSGRGSSGSNTREVDLLKKAAMIIYRNRVLKWIYFVKRFNNWPKEVYFRVPDTVLTTLDNGSMAMKSLQNKNASSNAAQ